MSLRKPYIRTVSRQWWKSNPFYRFYMLREATVLPMIFFTVLLMIGLGSLLKGPDSWQNWLGLMSHPIVMIINFIALIASFFHAYTFFSMMPKVMAVRVKQQVVDEKSLVLAQWLVLTIVSLLGLILI